MLNIPERLSLSSPRWKESLKQFGFDLRVAIPGIIDSFDPAMQTVRVQPALTEAVRIAGAVSVEQLPLLTDVPIVIPRAGGFAVTLPIIQGDECLVIFADLCINAWWQNGGVQNEEERRRHDLADAFAIIGCWSQPRVLANYSTASAQLRSDDGSVVLDLAPGQITITAQNVTVNATTADIAVSGTATVSGDTVNVTGNSQVNISGNRQTMVEGRNFLLHTHSGVASGGAVSGPVV